MERQPTLTGLPPFFFFLILSSFNVSLAGNDQSSTSSSGPNPFTAKAYLIRYWNNHITNNLPKPSFLLSKASPLNAVDSSFLAKLATDNNALSSHLQSFCSLANLFCFPDLAASLEKHDSSVDFSSYEYKNFTNYGTSLVGGTDSFKNYSGVFDNQPENTFRRYSRDSTGHNDEFTSYAPNANVPLENFNTYGSGATAGTGDFKHYHDQGVNIASLSFTTYEAKANGRKQDFSSYSTENNAGFQSFNNYGKNSNGVPTDFSSYGKGTNVIASNFASYGKFGSGAIDSFTSYADDGNNPTNNFKIYGEGGNAGTDSFTSYRDQSNVGDDSFRSYAKDSTSGKVDFTNYGNSVNEGTDTFKGYGKGSIGQTVDFKVYGVNSTFKDYSKNGINFSSYKNPSTEAKATESKVRTASKWVEPGKFFRESKLKQGTIMPMPDISDKMPKRSFLPRSISLKLPFSTSKISELKQIFHAENSGMAMILQNTLEECERKASRGETKRCVGSIEDMIDFAASVLGHNIVVRSTESVKGSKQDVLIGTVKGINGGKVTKSVSCHQSLFPYMVYYCHSVPKVRVYEADILDPKTKVKINHGVAICHIDTSAWSPTHGAFLALGSKPGQIEVCHWIFENDMTWATAD